MKIAIQDECGDMTAVDTETLRRYADNNGKRPDDEVLQAVCRSWLYDLSGEMLGIDYGRTQQ